MTTHRIAEVEGSKALTRSRLWQSGHRQLAGRRPRQERRGAYLPLRPRLALGGDGQAGSSIRGRWRLPPGDTPGLGTAVGGGARAASIKVSGRLTRSVRGIAAGGWHAVVLAGSCNVAPMGVWVGSRRCRCWSSVDRRARRLPDTGGPGGRAAPGAASHIALTGMETWTSSDAGVLPLPSGRLVSSEVAGSGIHCPRGRCYITPSTE
jgi:hypothetical protein